MCIPYSQLDAVEDVSKSYLKIEMLYAQVQQQKLCHCGLLYLASYSALQEFENMTQDLVWWKVCTLLNLRESVFCGSHKICRIFSTIGGFFKHGFGETFLRC